MPYGLAVATVTSPLLASASCLLVQSMYGCLAEMPTAIRLSTRMLQIVSAATTEECQAELECCDDVEDRPVAESGTSCSSRAARP